VIRESLQPARILALRRPSMCCQRALAAAGHLAGGVQTAKVGLALFCPVTGRAEGCPFEVALPPKTGVAGVVLSDQVKSLDWRARCAERIATLPAAALREVLAKLTTLVGD
jgi:mRNA interferase MazF